MAAIAIRGAVRGASSGWPGMTVSSGGGASARALLEAGSSRAGLSLIASSYVGGAPATVS